MTRFSNLAAAAAVATMMITAGCATAADEQEKANQAQADANGKISQAQADANAKMRTAQADADKKIAEAQASFMKLREDYRHAMTVKLVDLDKKVAELDARALKVTGKTKADLTANLKTIHESRDRLGSSFSGLDTATSNTWDATSTGVEKQWSDLKVLVDQA